MPMPTLMTDGKTRTAADLVTSSRDPLTREKKSLSVASTLASMRAFEAASPLDTAPALASATRRTNPSSQLRQLVHMAFPHGAERRSIVGALGRQSGNGRTTRA